MSRKLCVVLCGAMLAACSIPNGAFQATPDGGGGGGGGDGQPGVLSIVPSATAVQVDEGKMTQLTVTLSRAPAQPLTVTVATAAGAKLGIATPTLDFTPDSFDHPQTVTLSGLTDADTVDEHADVTLSATGVDTVTIAATVVDLDKVAIVADFGVTNTLTIPEGNDATVQVHLSAMPTSNVTVTALLGPGPAKVALPQSATLTFTPTDYDVDQAFTFHAPVDSNTTSEPQSLTLRATGLTDKVASLVNHDTTVVVQYGFPTAFTGASSILEGEVIAYKIGMTSTAMLDSFGVIIPAGTGDFRMALYADSGGMPGALVAQMPVRQAIGATPTNIGNITDLNLPGAVYWIAMRVAQSTSVDSSTTGTGPECVRNIDIANLDDAWPAMFGNASCSTNNFFNFFITTYHQ